MAEFGCWTPRIVVRHFPELIVSPEFIEVLLGQGDMNFTRLDQV